MWKMFLGILRKLVCRALIIVGREVCMVDTGLLSLHTVYTHSSSHRHTISHTKSNIG